MIDLAELKEQVCLANLQLEEHGLVIFTWGNVSAIDRASGLVAIKPSGVSYKDMQPEDMVVVDLMGRIVDGKYRPSSDTATHLALYQSFKSVGAIVHTHSRWATIWAQAGRSIPALGTTHADYFFGDIPCTRALSGDEIESNYEYHTGQVIAETFEGLHPDRIPGVLVRNHGPFAWGADTENAVYHAVVLEEVARMAYHTLQLSNVGSIDKKLLDKHYLRKHGEDAYYGQQ
jgi:L-ribulose-5-phosphate 4-epimerase